MPDQWVDRHRAQPSPAIESNCRRRGACFITIRRSYVDAFSPISGLPEIGLTLRPSRLEPTWVANRKPTSPENAMSMLELDAGGVDHPLPAHHLLLEERIGLGGRHAHRLDPDLAHLLLQLRLLHRFDQGIAQRLADRVRQPLG